MSQMIQRPSGRRPQQMRPLSFDLNVNRYAEGSVLVKAGNTHVLCTASVEESVPPWLAGKGTGWVTAEYSMLPRSTHTRSKRDREKVSGRTQEIQRLIGRALRTMVDMKKLGERSIVIDCDVIQADGGTRTASITGGCVALAMALEKIHTGGKPESRPWINTVSAVSIGLLHGQALVDLDYDEDSTCDVDMNFVLTGTRFFVEMQGTAERGSFSRDETIRMMEAAIQTTDQIRAQQLQALESVGVVL